jgi:hypothetical protein
MTASREPAFKRFAEAGKLHKLLSAAGLVGVSGRWSVGPDVVRLARKLALGYRLYFSGDVLNSEGRKLFEEMARMLVYEHPELKGVVTRARRNPTLGNVLKVLERVLGDEAEKLVREGVEGPYAW